MLNTKSLTAFLLLAICVGPTVHAGSLEWVRQFGTSEGDCGEDVLVDGLGNVYVSGNTSGDMAGPNAGNSDAFISKYNVGGTLEWTRQFGTESIDFDTAVSADGLGNVYISGYLGWAEGVQQSAFINKYEADGTLEWTRQLGTSEHDSSRGVSADGLGNVYISGTTKGDLGGPNAGGIDAFISKYDTSGLMQWTRQLGSSEDEWGCGVSADGLGSVYIAGNTEGDLGGPNDGYRDAYVSKYDTGGSLQWTRQLGTSEDDRVYDISADGLGSVYISGVTRGDLGGTNAGGYDAFISKYDAGGSLQWTRQFGTSEEDRGRSVSADGLGSVYISGWTEGNLGGTNAGNFDAFICKYDADGTLQWSQQLGSSEDEWGCGVSADGLGSVYISGGTSSDLGGTSAGGFDAFVAKFGASGFMPGDFNMDGAVDVIDLGIIATNYGATSGMEWEDGDATGDGAVDVCDLGILATNYGMGTPATVPEPSGVVLLLSAFGCCLMRLGRGVRSRRC